MKKVVKFMLNLYVIVPIITFGLLCYIIYKNFNYKDDINSYEEFFTRIDNKKSNVLKTSYDFNIVPYQFDSENNKVNQYAICMNKPLEEEYINDDIKLLQTTLENLYNRSYNNFAFKYVDLHTGYTLSYNEDQSIFAASTIKAPMAVYLYEMAQNKVVDLNTTLTYSPYYYNTGTGLLKERAFYQDYTARDLTSLAIIYSDNAAYNMLIDHFGKANMNNFWSQKGTNTIFKSYDNWGNISAHDAVIYMRELYDFYNTKSDLANELMDYFKKVTFKLIMDKNGYKNTASKSGWSGTVIHDSAIVLDENPYILVVLSNLGYSDYEFLFNQTSLLIGQIHEIYWNLKDEMCQKVINNS